MGVPQLRPQIIDRLRRQLTSPDAAGAPENGEAAPTRGAPPSTFGMIGHIRGSALILIGTVFGTGLELVSQVIAVRHLSRTDFGALSYAVAAVLLLQGLARLGLPETVARYLPVERSGPRPHRAVGLLLIASMAVVAISIAIVVAVWVFVPSLSPEFMAPISARLLTVLVVLVPIEGLAAILTSLFATYGQARIIIVRASIVAPLLRLAVTSALIWPGVSLDVVVRGYVAVSALTLGWYVWSAIAILRSEGAVVRPSMISWPVAQVFTFAPSMFATAIVWVLLDTSDALLLGYFDGPESVGLLRTVTPLARGNQLIVGSFIVLFLPLAATHFARSEWRALRDLYVRTATWLTLLAFPIFLLTFAFARPLVEGLYGERYESAVPILMLLSVGYFMQALTGYNGVTLKVYGRLRYAAMIDASAVLLNIGLNLVLIPRWGALGAGIGTTSTLVLHNVLKQVGVWRFAGITLWERGYLITLMGIVALTLLAWLINALMRPNLLAAVLISAASFVIVLFGARDTLEILSTFPEVRRVPIIGRIVAWRGRARQ